MVTRERRVPLVLPPSSRLLALQPLHDGVALQLSSDSEHPLLRRCRRQTVEDDQGFRKHLKLKGAANRVVVHVLLEDGVFRELDDACPRHVEHIQWKKHEASQGRVREPNALLRDLLGIVCRGRGVIDSPG